MKFAVVVPPSVSTLLDNVGVVLTAAVLYTTPLAVSPEPAMVWPPVEAAVLVIEEAATVVATVGAESKGTTSPVFSSIAPAA